MSLLPWIQCNKMQNASQMSTRNHQEVKCSIDKRCSNVTESAVSAPQHFFADEIDVKRSNKWFVPEISPVQSHPVSHPVYYIQWHCRQLQHVPQRFCNNLYAVQPTLYPWSYMNISIHANVTCIIQNKITVRFQHELGFLNIAIQRKRWNEIRIHTCVITVSLRQQRVI